MVQGRQTRRRRLGRILLGGNGTTYSKLDGVGHATSTDGFTWVRTGALATTSDGVGWRNMSTWMPSPVEMDATHYRVYFLGSDIDPNEGSWIWWKLGYVDYAVPQPAECATSGDCTGVVCKTVNCTDGACVYAPLPDGTPAGDGYRCLAGEGVACIQDDDCAARPCNSAWCNASHGCAYTPADDGDPCEDGRRCLTGSCVGCIADGDCVDTTGCRTPHCDPTNHTCGYVAVDDGTLCGTTARCSDGACIGCANATVDCEFQQCLRAACSVDHICVWTVSGRSHCVLPEGSTGHCSDGGTCHQCFADVHCERAGCTGVCTGMKCEYACSSADIYASGWWYVNAETAFYPPISFGEGTIAITSASVLRSYIVRSLLSNGLDRLAAELLVAKLNMANGLVPPADILAAMANADHILSLCPPRSTAVWQNLVSTGTCGGRTLVQIHRDYITLFEYTEGRADEFPCNVVITYLSDTDLGTFTYPCASP
jgi:hypothetical protein